jgi:hypothetical protein
MKTVTVTLDVAEELLAHFIEAAEASGRDPAKVLRDLMADYVRRHQSKNAERPKK